MLLLATLLLWPAHARGDEAATSTLNTNAEADAPLRLRDMLRLEARRARAGRYYAGSLSVLGAGAATAAGVISLTTAESADTARKTYSYVIVVSGGLGLVSSLYGMVSQSPLERLTETYEPIATDDRLPAEQRLQTGEQGLREVAAIDATSRRIGGITSIVLGTGLGGLAVWFGTTKDLSSSERLFLGTFTGISSILAIGSGIGRLWYQRGDAEIALAHWESARGTRHDAWLVPIIAPTQGGLFGGLSLSL